MRESSSRHLTADISSINAAMKGLQPQRASLGEILVSKRQDVRRLREILNLPASRKIISWGSTDAYIRFPEIILRAMNQWTQLFSSGNEKLVDGAS